MLGIQKNDFDVDAVPMADLLYIAGFMDGEGCFRMARRLTKPTPNHAPFYSVHVSVAGIERAPLDLIAKHFGGRVQGPYNYSTTAQARKDIFLWSASGHRAVHISRALQPFLLVKQRQAQIICDFMEAQPSSKQAGMGKGNRVTPEEIQRRDKCYVTLCTLNQRRRATPLSEVA